MHITVDRRDLLRALTSASCACARKSSVPILHNALLTVGDTLTIAGTDLTRTSITKIPRVILFADPPYQATIEPERIVKLLKKNGEKRVEINIQEESVDIVFGSTHLSLPSSKADEFPTLPFRGDHRPLATFEFDSGKLQDALADSIPTICDDITRPYLNGLALQFDEGSPVFVSTDGHRMTRRHIRAIETEIDEQNSFLIPKTGIEEAMAMLKSMKDPWNTKIEFMLGDDHKVAIFTTAQENAEKQIIKQELWVRLPDAEFPPWRNVWPQTNGIHIKFDADEIREVAEEARNFCSRSRSIQIIPKEDGVRIAVESPGEGKYIKEVSAEVTGNPPTIGLNVDYIQDALKSIGGSTVTVHMGGVLDATLWSSDEPGCEVVVMPVRG